MALVVKIPSKVGWRQLFNISVDLIKAFEAQGHEIDKMPLLFLEKT